MNKNLPKKNQSSDRLSWLDFLLLLGWLVIGIILKLTNLDAKPASSIEIATMGFSLGHGFAQIPLDQVISISTLLSPLQFDATVNSGDVVERLLSESTHPPLYFWLTHWWIKLLVSDGKLVSLAVGRSLSVLFGGLTIPAIFGFCWVGWRSRLVAHLAAVLMTVSPYGIYLAQEARHYTLSVCWIIASLTCLIVAINCLNRRVPLPWWIVTTWILINSLGIATHYFFALALGLEGLILIGLWFWERNHNPNQPWLTYWWRIAVVGLGTLAGCLVWLPVVNGISSNELTDWIKTSYDLDEIWQPVPRLVAWLITMVMLLPIEGTSTPVTIISGLVVLSCLIWIMPALIRAWKSLLSSNVSLPTVILANYWLGAIILYLLIIYGYGKDLSLAARYHFVYFPVVIVLLALALAQLWQTASIQVNSQQRHWFSADGKKVAAIVILMGFLGSLTVVNNFGFQKSRHSDALAAHIQANSTVPTLVTMTYTTHSELRELVALALSFERLHSPTNSLAADNQTPRFLLLQQKSTTPLETVLSTQAKPLDLWGVNLKVEQNYLAKFNCLEDNQLELSDSGYSNHLYHCR